MAAATAARLQQRISIIGASVTGLVTAHSLHRAGFTHIRLFDSASSLKHSATPLRNGGVVLASPGVRLLAQSQLLPSLYEQYNCNTIDHITVRNASDHPLYSYSPKELSRPKHSISAAYNRYSQSYPYLAIHGAKLHDALCEALPTDVIVQCGANLKGISKATKGGGVKLHFTDAPNKEEDKDAIESDLIIGADGMHSQVRQHLMSHASLPSPTRLPGVYLRGITPASQIRDLDKLMSGRSKGDLVEILGTGKKFAWYWIDKESIAWMATVHEDFGAVGKLSSTFLGFPEPIPSIIASADASTLSQYDISYLDSSPHLHDSSTNRIVLAGEAAHASTQEMWLNAAQDMEDACVLSTLLANLDRPQALRLYSEMRYARTKEITQMCVEETGQAIKKGRFMSALRDMSTSMTPPSVIRDQISRILEYDALSEVELRAPAPASRSDEQ